MDLLQDVLAGPAPILGPDRAPEIWQALDQNTPAAAVAWWDQIDPAARSVDSYIGATFAMRQLSRFSEADSLLQEATHRFPDHPQPRIDLGWLEYERGNLHAALARWHEARRFIPRHPAPLRGASMVLRDLGQLAEAEAILAEAAAQFPDDLEFRLDLAGIAAARGDHASAAARFRQILADLPEDNQARFGLAGALASLGEFPDQDAAMLALFPPPTPEFLIQHAEQAQREADWPAAAARWRAALAAWVDDRARGVNAAVQLAACLFNLRAHDEAEVLLAAWTARYPDDLRLARMFASCAMHSDRHEAAVARWQMAAERFPNDISCLIGLIRAHTNLGNYAEARRMLAAALPRYPDDRGLKEIRAEIATRTGKWDEAIRIWQELVSAYPQDSNLRNQLMAAKFGAELARAGGGESVPLPDIQPNIPAAGSRLAEIITAFESLGQNCEFGVLQRYLGKEPLGLLRWAGIHPSQIIAALQARFEGVGEPENTIIDVWPNGEYCISDRHFYMLTHSFTYESAVDRDSFHRQQVKRGRYLKRQLLEDIEDGEKIFVYQSPYISEAEGRELYAALQSIAPAWLLLVRLADQENPAGTVEQADERFLIGYIEQFESMTAVFTDATVARWAPLCEQAYQIRQAAAAFSMRDLPNAMTLLRDFRANFPNNVQGYLGGGLASIEAGDFAGADAIYRDAMARLPVTPKLLKDYAFCAEKRRDLPEAVRRYMAMMTQVPDVPDGYHHAASLLRQLRRLAEADGILSRAVEKFPGHADMTFAWAMVAHERRDWPEAIKRWDRVISSFGGGLEARRLAAEALMALNRFADAQTVLAPALRMFPDDKRIAVMNGQLAARRRDAPEAERVWRDIRQRFPDDVAGHTGLAAALLQLDRADEAETVFREAAARFPENRQIAIDMALIPQRKQEWDAAIARWRDVIERFPESARGFIGLGECLLGKQEVTAALAAYEAGFTRFPDDFSMGWNHANAAARAGDRPEAIRRWGDLIARFPGNPAAYAGRGRALRESGALDEAAAFLTESLKRFPENVEIETELALALSWKRDWPPALALWESLKRRFPEHGGVRSGIVQILPQALMDRGVGRAEAAFDIPDLVLKNEFDAGAEEKALRDLLMRFESLGDSCEFGSVQRRYGAEPVSLLRWTSTPPEYLVATLNERFAGVGEPEYTIIAIGHDEFTTMDRRYHMFSHTFTPATSEPLETFSEKQYRRMQYLRRCLIEELTAAEKIFVYKSMHGLTDEQIDALYQAMQVYAKDVALLCVRLQDSEQPAGTLKRVRDRLFVGTIDKFSTTDISTPIWVSLCQQTAREVDAAHDSQTG
jgi:tetratricopeptide (TPR) repeat protein